MEIQELKSLIREAFKDVEYPGDDHIAGCSRIGCDECEGIAEHFKGTTWQEHNLQTLLGYDTLALFHTEARHYYLPAFMLADIGDNQSESGSVSNLNIAFRFISHEHESFQEERRNFLSLFSPQQRRAVIEYLKYVDTFEGVYEPDKDTLEAINFLENG